MRLWWRTPDDRAAEERARAHRPGELTFTEGRWRDLHAEEVEAAKIRAELASREAQHRAVLLDRAADSEQAEEYRQARDAAARRELPGHLLPPGQQR